MKAQVKLTVLRLFAVLIMIVGLATVLPMSATAVQPGTANQAPTQSLFAQSDDDDDDDNGSDDDDDDNGFDDDDDDNGFDDDDDDNGSDDDDDDNGSGGGGSGGNFNSVILGLIQQLLALLQLLLR